MVGLEPRQDLLQSRVVFELESVPERPGSLAILFTISGCLRVSYWQIYLVLSSSNRLREPEERQCQIYETVLIVLQLVLLINDLPPQHPNQHTTQPSKKPTKSDLVKLQADQASHERRGGRDRRDDLSGNLLGLMPTRSLDGIVHRAQVGRRSDKVDMEVGIIVFLEFDRVEAVSSKRGRRR